MTEEFHDMTDIQLAERANAGLSGQGANVEMMRRLRDALIQAHKATNLLNSRLLWCTVAIFGVTLLQLVVAICVFVQSS